MGRANESQHDRRAADSCGEYLIVGGELLDLRFDLGDLRRLWPKLYGIGWRQSVRFGKHYIKGDGGGAETGEGP